MVQDPILSKAAIAALASPNPSAVSDALTYLTKFGDESARQPILDRYRNWSKKWSDHDTYVNDDPRYDPENPEHETFAAEREDHDLGVTLILALLTNQGWIPDAKFTAAVLSQCGGVTCDRVKSFAIPDFTVSVTRDSYETRFRVGPFESTTMELFEAKLDQFPKGTTFTMTSAWSDRIEEQNQLEASMPALFARHGMKLITPTP
jgi:hypothetical protein